MTAGKQPGTSTPPRMPGQEQWVEVLGVPVRYYRQGVGPPLVLLHGLGEAALVWYGNVEPLAQRFTVYVPDLAGHGASGKPQWRYTLPEGVAFVSGFLDALALPKASLLGNSLGGLLSLAMAVEAPQRVQGLVLEDTAGLGKEVAWFLRLMSLRGMGEVLARPTKAGLRRLLHLIFYDPRIASEELVEALHKERARPGNSASLLRILRQGVSLRGVRPTARLTDRLAEVRAPTLLLWGRQDRIFPVFHAERAVPRLPKGHGVVFDRCGHWPHIEVRDQFNRTVSRFLTEHS